MRPRVCLVSPSAPVQTWIPCLLAPSHWPSGPMAGSRQRDREKSHSFRAASGPWEAPGNSPFVGASSEKELCPGQVLVGQC